MVLKCFELTLNKHTHKIRSDFSDMAFQAGCMVDISCTSAAAPPAALLGLDTVAGLLSKTQKNSGVRDYARTVDDSMRPVVTLEAVREAWAIGKATPLSRGHIIVSSQAAPLRSMGPSTTTVCFPPAPGDTLLRWPMAARLAQFQGAYAEPTVALWADTAVAGYVAATDQATAAMANAVAAAGGDNGAFAALVGWYREQGYYPTGGGTQ